MEDNAEIQKLLRLKRYEQPPAGYHEMFLREFQNRQRAELIRRSPWQNFWERFIDSLPEIRVPATAYATIGVLGIACSVFILNNADEPAHLAAAPPEASQFNLYSQNPVFIPASSAASATPASSKDRTLPPYYVIQSQPVSYEAPLSF